MLNLKGKGEEFEQVEKLGEEVVSHLCNQKVDNPRKKDEARS